MTATRKKRREIQALLGFLVTALLVATVGGVLTSPNAASMFENLHRPSWAPPGRVFGPVWSVLYIMIAVSGWLAWRRGLSRAGASWYAAQYGFNLAWSFLYFHLAMPRAALTALVVLLACILGTMAAFARLSRPAAALLVPYALWVAFAGVLNLAIIRLNAF
ncbi:MAG: tryptophan-rich sensory protein [Proteobacteria bacterium]|nr:tryptophan-rich sensory protein [Pseudomonadota bacterium]